MPQYIVTALLLALVALSSSNVLPVSISDLNREPLGLDGHSDNTYSNRYQSKNVLDEIYNMYVERENRPGLINKLQLKYTDTDNKQNDDIFSIINKDDNYNGEGFRKEQWHNYPRQLDRLHEFYGRNAEKRNFDPDPDDDQYTAEVAPDDRDTADKTNEYSSLNSIPDSKVYDTVLTPTNPFLILKIRLACLNKDIDNGKFATLITGLESNYQKEDERNENPEVNVMKVKREDIPSSQNNELTDNTTQKVVNKRIFSLWSRLQSLNHKGHELQHRRHLHAFYSLPDSDGGGTLTAETRATLMRPPGSPLRWG
ncbi:uncharacterized protein LOC113492550 isoform X2 [Trichoplusia ni]|nr:uncharacterized protein LOC113492550 isoform X2 [Trichoplusia ni]